jgi:hypothetical protein
MHKDIEYLCERNQWNPNETIIIDDNITVILTNDKKCIQVEPFIVFSKNTASCKNPSYFGPFETTYARVENLILNTDSKNDYCLYSIIDYLRSQKEA